MNLKVKEDDNILTFTIIDDNKNLLAQIKTRNVSVEGNSWIHYEGDIYFVRIDSVGFCDYFTHKYTTILSIMGRRSDMSGEQIYHIKLGDVICASISKKLQRKLSTNPKLPICWKIVYDEI